MDDVSEELGVYDSKIKAPLQTAKIVIFKWMRTGKGRGGRSMVLAKEAWKNK